VTDRQDRTPDESADWTHGPAHDPAHDPECAVAHGEVPDDRAHDRELVAVYATPLAAHLLRWGAELGFRTVLLDPDGGQADGGRATDGGPAGAAGLGDGTVVYADVADAPVGATTDVVVTDHHRDDLGAVLAPLVTARPRWIGIIGSPRHTGPHIAALREEGVDEDLIATVRRPIGVDIGSKTPPEIALSVLAGLLADRNGRDAGLPPRPTIELPA
jgi:xanthine dehydrogenase accessory factor